MIGIQWQGFDIKDLEHEIHAIIDQIEVDARQILDDIAREVVDEMYSILIAARTATGDRREAAGQGIAGRVDTGSMARDIKAALESDIDGAVVLTWGWVDHFEEYYLLQEYGTNKIRAMSALQQSYIKGRERLHERLQAMGLEVH